MDEAAMKPTIDIIVCSSMNNHHASAKKSDDSISNPRTKASSDSKSAPFLTKIHAGYFFICLSFGAQALLWKSLILIATILSFLYMLKCILHFNAVKDEFSHHIGVNYMYTPWISYLLMLQSSPPSIVPRTCYYEFLCLSFSFVVFLLDVKLFGQWFTTEKRFLSVVANPVNLVSVIGNLVAAQAATEIGWNECALSMFSLGMHGKFSLEIHLRFFSHLIKDAVLSLFVPFSFSGLQARTVQENYKKVKNSMASGLMLLICIVSVLVFVFLMLTTVLKIEKLMHKKAPTK
ncbi:unnamed protein product [Vicia faba]|uniref:Uncharacterized protein n=1 Tax=Vicia faba TaxID=3906 RepID=A0AAV1AMH7_VICFA|nr:unnamed protein product [Vicia faba]